MPSRASQGPAAPGLKKNQNCKIGRKIVEKTSVLLVREAKILEKTSVFRVSEAKIVEKTSVFRDSERQRVSRESPERLQSVSKANNREN